MRRISRAGFPAMIVFGSTSWVTTLPAPTTASHHLSRSFKKIVGMTPGEFRLKAV